MFEKTVTIPPESTPTDQLLPFRFVCVACWRTAKMRQYDVTDPRSGIPRHWDHLKRRELITLLGETVVSCPGAHIALPSGRHHVPSVIFIFLKSIGLCSIAALLRRARELVSTVITMSVRKGAADACVNCFTQMLCS